MLICLRAPRSTPEAWCREHSCNVSQTNAGERHATSVTARACRTVAHQQPGSARRCNVLVSLGGVPDIVDRRLRAQRLAGKPFPSAVDAVRWLGAVQSQDYAGAKWALGQRSAGATDAELDRLFDEGSILRTHVLRPTWHFVLPEDVGWLVGLTGPRVSSGLAGRYRELEIDEKVVTRAKAAFVRALERGRHLTRNELGEVLRAARISPEGQRLPHLILAAELDSLVVSGPRRGKQHTYALLEERVPKGRALQGMEAIAELVRRYFRSHGPAMLPDFVWWSGLRMADARTAVGLEGPNLGHQVIHGNDYWFDAADGSVRSASKVAHLLPNFDEFIVAYRNRADVMHPDRDFRPELFAFGSILANVVTIGGRVHGAWRRLVTAGGIRVEVRPLGRLEPADVAAVGSAGQRFSRFLGRPVELVWL